MNRVLPGLFIGNYRDSKDNIQLERHRITHIIAIYDAARRIFTNKEYLCIMASDSPNQNLIQYFSTCNDFIHNARLQNGCVLIHCIAGMSRSCSIAVQYLMSTCSLSFKEAFQVVRCARPLTNPNTGFQKQLQEFENTKLLEERRRLIDKYTPEHWIYLSVSDEEHCKKILNSYKYNNLLFPKERRIHSAPSRLQKGELSTSGSSSLSTYSPSISTSGSRRSLNTSVKSSTTRSTTSVTTAVASSASLSTASPTTWERHYGCWKNHLARQKSVGSSPVLYSSSTSLIGGSNTSLNSIGGSVCSLPAIVAGDCSYLSKGISGSTSNISHSHSESSSPNLTRSYLGRGKLSSPLAQQTHSHSSGIRSCPNSPSKRGQSARKLYLDRTYSIREESIHENSSQSNLALSTPRLNTTSISNNSSCNVSGSRGGNGSSRVQYSTSAGTSKGRQARSLPPSPQIGSTRKYNSSDSSTWGNVAAGGGHSSGHSGLRDSTISSSSSSHSQVPAIHSTTSSQNSPRRSRYIVTPNNQTKWIMKRSAYPSYNE